MQLYLAFYQQVSVPMFCYIPHGSSIAQGRSVTCQKSWTNLVEEIGNLQNLTLLSSTVPLPIWGQDSCKSLQKSTHLGQLLVNI